MTSPGISITDHEGKIVRKNSRYDAIFAGSQKIGIGAKPHEICKGWFKNFEQSLQAKDWPAMRAMAGRKLVLGVEIDMQQQDGSFITILESAKPIMDAYGRIAGATVITQDITKPVHDERMYLESLLARLKNQAGFRLLAESIPQLVWTATLTGGIDFFNQTIQRYQGYQRREDGLWDCEEVFYPEDSPEAFRRIREMVETEGNFGMQLRLRMADGSYRWHDSQMVPVRDGNGQILRWLGIARDIHEEKMIEQALLHTGPLTGGLL